MIPTLRSDGSPVTSPPSPIPAAPAAPAVLSVARVGQPSSLPATRSAFGGSGIGGRDGEVEHRALGLHRTADDLSDFIARATKSSRADARAALEARNPQGQFIQPQEDADVVLWLCSTASTYVIGQGIAVSTRKPRIADSGHA